MLMASVLAVVAGSPAQAANTSSEALIDTNDDGVGDAREFGGRDRYDTSLRLAKNFAKGKGGLGSIPTAFVASGLSLVDAVSVSGLAGFLDAPVLLTPVENLHGGVADFIEDYGVDTVYVLGGSGAVADSILEDLEALANEPTVERIEGIDRYATAAAAAAQLGGGAAWCGGEDAAAILVNGGDVSLVEAMMVGPIAHRLQLPVLMTAADELPMATIDLIEAEDIEHVVIVGDTNSVSEDVANAVSDAGVDTVARIMGDTAAATSVALAELGTGDCKDDLAPISDNAVALVHRDALPDGVSAAPVLSSTYRDGSLVPVLIVGDTLPASVSDYLAATPQADDNGVKLNLSIVAIGGTGAVSASVMEAALAAAASADALTVQIGNGGAVADLATAQADAAVNVNNDDDTDASDAPQPGDNRIRLYFSDNVDGDDTDTQDVDELENAIRDILEINGAPARLASAQAGDTAAEPPTLKHPVHHGTGTSEACDPDIVTVTLASPLKAGDTISIVGGAKLGSSGDQRAVGAESVTVAAASADRSRPSVSVILIAGQQDGYVSIIDNGKPLFSEPDADPPVLARLTPANVTVRLGTAAAQTLAAADGTIDEFGNIKLASGETFTANDRVTIAAGAVADGSKNKSLQRSFTAIKAQASPRITSVLMSSLNHSEHATAAVPISLTDGNGEVPTGAADDATEDIWISAKSDGVAAGAAGNNWSVTFDRASTYDAAKDLDIDVRVNTRDQSVFVRFNNGKAKFADLKAALEANSAFDALFEVKVDPDAASTAGGACGKAANKDLAIARGIANPAAGTPAVGGSGLARGHDSSTAEPDGGMTKVAIQVTFNGYIKDVNDELLLEDVLNETVERDNQGAKLYGGDYLQLAVALKISDAGVSILDAAEFVTFSDPGTKVTYSLKTEAANALPQVRDLVVTAGARNTREATDTVTAIDLVVGVATGYVVVDETDVVAGAANLSMNGPSQVRIARSSSVDAPK